MVRRVERPSPPQLRPAQRGRPRPTSAWSGAAVVALTAALSASACQTTAEADDELVPPGHGPATDPGDDGAAPTDAGTPDAGATDAEASAADLSFIHNQLILKPKLLASGERPSADVIRADVEAATGASVAELRPGPAGIVLVVFTTTEPPRDGAALAALQAALEATDAYEYVQRNRLYEAKSGEGGT